MDPGTSALSVSDVVMSTAGHDTGKLYYVIHVEQQVVWLVNGKDRRIENPKRKKRKHAAKVLRSETRVAAKILSGDKVLNSELRRDLAFHVKEMQANNLGG